MTHRIFEYALIYQPKDKDKKPLMIRAPTPILATSLEAVQKIAARQIPDTYTDCLDEVEIAVRPF